MITIGHITPATFVRSKYMKIRRGCDAVSLTDFGLILTIETDYILKVVEHSISDISRRQM